MARKKRTGKKRKRKMEEEEEKKLVQGILGGAALSLPWAQVILHEMFKAVDDAQMVKAAAIPDGEARMQSYNDGLRAAAKVMADKLRGYGVKIG